MSKTVAPSHPGSGGEQLPPPQAHCMCLKPHSDIQGQEQAPGAGGWPGLGTACWPRRESLRTCRVLMHECRMHTREKKNEMYLLFSESGKNLSRACFFFFFFLSSASTLSQFILKLYPEEPGLGTFFKASLCLAG